MPVDKSTKKRSHFARITQRFANPEWATADKRYAYRWVKEENNPYMSSNGIDSRGWEKFKVPEGQPGAGDFLRTGEHIFCRMPAELNEEIKQEKLAQARANATRETEVQQEQMDRIGHEVRNKGGKIKFEYEVGGDK